MDSLFSVDMVLKDENKFRDINWLILTLVDILDMEMVVLSRSGVFIS